MNRKIWSYLQIAGQTAKGKEDKRSFLIGVVGLRSDGALVKAFNSSTTKQTAEAHAEYRVSGKLDYGATVYVARVKIGDGSFGLAKPCANCVSALRSKRVHKAYYTISDNEFGVIEFTY